MKKTYLFTFVGLMLVILLVVPLANAAIPAAERAALIALYNSTNGDSWTNNSGWKTPPLDSDGFAMPGTEGSWYGITADSNRATVVGLYSNNLSGSIPPELGNLANLTFLSLGSNQLSGSIPPELGNLTNLQTLRLYSNQLSGSIPLQLVNLTNLLELDLRFNQLSGSIPPELSNLTNLQYLYLSHNQLSGSIPPELSNLTNLQYLYLSHNQLSGSIPPELGNLANLTFLSLGSNQLSGSIPLQLMNLTSLVDNSSDFRWNHLFTTNDDLRNFLNSKQIGGDWESHQTPPFTRAMPWIPLLLMED